MPTQKPRLTKTEREEYRTRLRNLQKIGIQIGRVSSLVHEPSKLSLEQIDHEFATIYELPGRQLAVVVVARMIVLISGMLITALEMTTPWNGPELDLHDPEGAPYYKDLIQGLPQYPPRLLNNVLMSEVPLRRRQVEGVIVAYGSGSIPPKLHDETFLMVNLLLGDEHRSELCFEFGVRVDRSVKRKYERLHRTSHEGGGSTNRVPLFEGELVKDPETASTEKTVKDTNDTD